MKETDALVRVQEIDLALMRHKRTLQSMACSMNSSGVLLLTRT